MSDTRGGLYHSNGIQLSKATLFWQYYVILRKQKIKFVTNIQILFIFDTCGIAGILMSKWEIKYSRKNNKCIRKYNKQASAINSGDSKYIYMYNNLKNLCVNASDDENK